MHVFMYACVLVCLHVHVSGREEWKEFPALFCVGVKDLGGRERVPGCHGLTVKARKEETQQVLHNIHIP